ncbi:SDR family NAD(P)-dependent oxidoreductase [Nocardiopsis sp. RSe5-2]|uniref:SDR family NAD(P)-dependent oxidoreductase n=1 Tax=Nocardiopsis endophytica TaxID=3018445 RepID=A0ABT4U3K9_9ACTN|nr:type I polyketide synthase [Nocardiopsis endophytica]MDA2810897.1 SDR family NAD(P)-dependent oxidoreductase [Nocardiopsis endophytica]
MSVTGYAGQAVAVVGAGCRLPGGIDGLDALWQALEDGRDLVGRVPEDRFDTARFVDESAPRPGKSYTAAGAFLDDIASFDADYFGISPREAAPMDPQHRLLLEMTAEALDDAAIAPSRLAGTDTGVFIGISDSSYGALQMSSNQRIGPYTAPGGAHSIAANRVSHAFDLHGPSMAVDTACSSSLIALERACRQVAAEGGTALAGGVNLLLSPHVFVAFSQASMLSPAGRCAAFSANADGFVRAEGGGMVVLKRLEDARADGDRVHAVLVGWGANSDGHTAGLALPSPEAQEELLRSVYDRSGTDPAGLVYMEAHGTGTPVGDPSECAAIGRALGRSRPRPLPIGSVKSNLGHLEPASGMAGLFKAMLVLRHRRIPASLHASPLNPDIDFQGLGLAPAVEPLDVAVPDGGPALAGVNSFGFGGANAHVVVAEPPSATVSRTPVRAATGHTASASPIAEAGAVPESADEHGAAEPSAPLPVVVSARTPEALAEAVERTAQRLESADPAEFYDLAYTSAVRRGAHPFRVAVRAEEPRRAARLLRAADTAAASPAADDGRVAFVFCGNGSQWAGMGADLLHRDPVFTEAVHEADAALAPHLEWSVAKEMALPPDQWRLERTEVAQPLLFAVQVGLDRMLRAQGIRPSAVVGHSVGEVAAAWACGALTLEQAARVVAARGLAQAPTAGSGRMAAAALSPDQAEEVLAGRPGLEVAGINSAGDVTLAGDAARLAELGEELERRGVFFRMLDLDYAFHSSAMDTAREPLLAALEGLAPFAPEIPLASTVTGALVEDAATDAGHWWRGVRDPVLFGPATERLRDTGIGVFVEVGPHPVLRSYLRRTLNGDRTRRAVRATLDRDVPGPQAMEAAVGGIIAAGADVDRRAHFPRPGRVADLPAYPWQRARHWQGGRDQWAAVPAGPVEHPLLGQRLPAAAPAWEGPIEPAMAPWIGDHRLGGTVVFPGAGYIEMGLAAGKGALGGPVEADGWEFTRALPIDWARAGDVHVQTSLSLRDGTVDITSTDRPGGEPRLHARGRVRRLVGWAPEPMDLEAARERCPNASGPEEVYRRFTAIGLNYGPAFRPLTGTWIGPGEVLASYSTGSSLDGLVLPPVILDACLQAGLPMAEGLLEHDALFLPVKMASVKVWRAPEAQGWVHVLHRTRSAEEPCWDMLVTDSEGRVCAEIEGARLRRLSGHGPRQLSVQRTVLKAAPLPDAPHGADGSPRSPLPSPTQALAHAEDRLRQVREDWPRWGHPRFTEDMQVFLSHAVARWLTELAPGIADGGATAAELEAAGVRGHFRRFLDLCLPTAEGRGTLSRTEDGRLRAHTSPERFDAAFRTLVEEHPAYASAAMLVQRNADELAPMARGETDPLEVFADAGGGELVRQFFSTNPPIVFCYRLAQALLGGVLAGLPQDRPLRVLEIGAGTAGLTGALLPLLPAGRTLYTVTDASPYFFAAAQKQLAGYDGVDYRVLDLDTDPAEQGFTPGAYDLVVAGNALHTAEDMAAALPRVASLLAPDGRLLAVEQHDALAPALGFAVLESFWESADTGLRPDGAFLSRGQWEPLLREAGFTDVVQVGDDEGPDSEAFSVILAARGADAPAAAAPPAAPAPEGVHVVVAEAADELPTAEALAGMCPRGRAATAPADEEGWWALLGGDAAEATVTVLLSAPSRTGGGADGGTESGAPDPVASADRRGALLRGLVAALPESTADRALVLVTRPSGVHPAPERCDEPADAAVWGMARTLSNERPDLSVTRISLERGGDPGGDARCLGAELAGRSAEDEVVLTRQGRFVPRVVEDAPTVPAEDAGPVALALRDIGLNYRLEWARTGGTAVPSDLAPGTVAIDVRAGALNYRDIMRASGLLPAELVEGTHTEHGLGLECAGTVAAVGPGVRSVAPGDRVMAVAPHSLASQVVTVDHALCPIPEGVSFAEAATMPVVYCTVDHALGEVARLGEGETLLVHGGAGGVGLAAIRYARLCGAEVIATAGSEAKRSLLRRLGVRHVLDSRSLDFAPQVRELTGGRGVDVVLNSLAGEALQRSLEVVAPFGRFVELGKRDFVENSPLPMRPLSDNVAFFGVDLTGLINDPQRCRRMFERVGRRIHDGDYRPLPHTAYPAARAREAFTLLQHSRHVGKVVVTHDPLDPLGAVRDHAGAPAVLRPDGAYLITGGLEGLGAATARRLAVRGVRRLALVSRRGASAPGADALIEELAGLGARATAHAADCSDAAAMRAVLEEVEADGAELRGVVHAAMCLDDDEFGELGGGRFATALVPKIGGARVLDDLTRGRDLDLFCVYSSEASLFGSIRQASYNAANAYLEALVRARRARGEAGTAVQWGQISDTGYVARHGLSLVLSRFGLDPITSDEAFGALERRHGHDVFGVARLNTGELRLSMPKVTGSPRMSALAGAASKDAASLQQQILDRLAGLDPEQAHRALSDHLAKVLGGVMQVDPERLDHHRRLDEYGMDSLMATELLATFNHEYGLEIPPLELLRSGGTIADLSQLILLRLGLAAKDPDAGAVAQNADAGGANGADAGGADDDGAEDAAERAETTGPNASTEPSAVASAGTA